MNIKYHFILYTFYSFLFISFEQHITKLLSNMAYTFFQTCSQVSQCSPRHIFWYRWNLLPNCNLEVIEDSWPSGVHFRFEAPPKHTITGREIRRTWRPWKLASQWNNALRKYFPNDIHVCSRSMSSCTILLELSSTTTQFWCEEVP
jgi:hypothetical protein